MICPSCAHDINISAELVQAHQGSTLDCPICDTLLIIKGEHLKEFHSYLNQETEGAWPKDGKNTGYIQI
jgi:uncharacterized Zn finger protein